MKKRERGGEKNLALHWDKFFSFSLPAAAAVATFFSKYSAKHLS